MSTLSLLLSVMAALSAVAAQSAADASAKSGKKSRNPNEMICTSEPVLGSRLAKRRMCMTRSQWAERKNNDRALVERSQLIPCTPTRGSNCY